MSQVTPGPIGFVLGGGGSLGSLPVGMLQALAEMGIAPDLVVGTSVGSLDAAVGTSRREIGNPAS